MSEPAAKPRPMIDLDEFERRLRRPAAAPQAQEDPLAELARLVGGHEDPFKMVFEQDGHLASRQRQASEPFDAPPASQDGAYAPEPYYADEEPALHGTIHPEAYRREEPAMPDDKIDHYGVPVEEQGYAWPEVSERIAPQLAQEQRSRRPLFGVIAIIAAGIFGIGVSFAYKSKSKPHEIATIQAMSGPTKIQPDSPGGMDVPNQDASILNTTPQPTPAKLVSHEEQPVDLALQQSAQPPRTAMADAGAFTGAGGIPVPPAQSVQASAAQPDVQSYGIGALIEPKKVKTVSVRSDGTVLPNDTPPQMPGGTAAAAPRPAAPTASTTAPKPAATPKSTARVVTTPKPAPSIEQLAEANDAPAAPAAALPPAAAAPALAKPKPVPAKPVKLASAEPAGEHRDSSRAAGSESGGFAVQFGAPASEQEAHEMTAKLTGKYGGDLSGHRLTYHRAQIGEKTVFRIRTSGLTREEAAGICEKVKSSGGSCFIAKN